jgi:hypothetical protein
LEISDVKNSFAQRDRGGVRGDEVAGDFRPRIDHLGFAQALA